jgi:hypothetical protein
MIYQRKINKNYNIYSTIRDLRSQNKSNDYFEIMVSNLSLEELIALKLELVYKSIGIPLYGLPLWQSMPNLCREALLKYSISITRSKTEAARYLGLQYGRFKKILKKYNLEHCYQSTEKGDETNVTNNRSPTKENLS